MVRLWFWTAGVGVALWLLQAFLAWIGNMLYPAQMKAAGIEQGITFFRHGSTWMVLFGLIPLMATLVALHAEEWTMDKMIELRAFGYQTKVYAVGFALIIAILISAGMHYLYTLVPYPDYMITDGGLNAAGKTHFVLFTAAITILILTYIATENPNPALLLFTAWYMTAHVFAGNHMLEKMNPSADFPPYPLWDAGPWGAVIAVALIFGTATWWRIG